MPELPRTQVAATVLAAIVVVVLGVRWIAAQGPDAAAGSSAAPVARAPGGRGVALERPPAPDALVHVAGAVRRPGVYRLPGGARVRDAVRRAGGAAAGGDANAINLAAKVVDGQQVVVPRRQAAATTASAPAAAGPAAAPVSLGSATLEQLDTLDGVGPATAQKILAYREQHGFRTVDDLANVPGIGPKKLAALKGQVQP